jgi:enoyl-CoA hydratase
MDYQLSAGSAILNFDDGKANVVSHAFIDGMNEGLERAVAEASAVIVRGREGMFSAGFDLSEFKKGPAAGAKLAYRGFELFTRMYAHPQPLIAACTGHAVAAGAFLLLAADTRVGIEGDFKFCLPETAISMNIPRLLRELAGSRLAPQYLTAAVLQSHSFDPHSAREAGFLDEVVAADALDDRVAELAAQLAQLPPKFYDKNKQDLRSSSLQVMREELAAFKKSAGL